MVRALDLRIRISLLPGLSAEVLDDPFVPKEAQIMLVDNPETSSIAVVVDNNDLTCRIIQPFDAPHAVVAPSSTSQSSIARTESKYGPVGTVLRQHLRHINPGWNPPSRVQRTDPNLDDAVRQAASEALTHLKAQRKRTPEWRTARESIPHEAVDWLADLALSILQGSDVNIESALESYFRRRTK